MKRMLAVAAIVELLLISTNVHAGIPVSIVANTPGTAEHVESMAKYVEQIAQLKKQLEQAKQQYQALTGNRGLGSILNNPTLKQALPPEWQNIYSAGQSGNYGISGSITDILNQEKYSGSITDMQKSIQDRTRQNAATDKAVGLKAYEGAQQRLTQIESLMQQINGTQDPKAIGELQARIAIEQAAIQNETTKLQMISQLQQAEKQLVKEQKRDMSRRILNSTNTGMPRIQ